MTDQETFSDVLYTMPALWSRLLTEHVPDTTGQRCRACTIAGTGSPGASWPCRIRDAAEAARDRYHHRVRPAFDGAPRPAPPPPADPRPDHRGPRIVRRQHRDQPSTMGTDPDARHGH